MHEIDYALALSLGINYLLETKGGFKYERNTNQINIRVGRNR